MQKKLSFRIDWTEPEGIHGPELSATCAEFWMQVGDTVITRVEGSENGAIRDTVHVSLYPLAEWLATNWWFLTSERLNPDKERDPEFLKRHALRTNLEGYAFPNIEVVSSGALTRIAWKRGTYPWTKVRFLEDGQERIDGAEFREQCSALIDRVIDRLESHGVSDTLLQDEWIAIQQADGDEARFCEVSAGLGLDPYDLTHEQRSLIPRLDEELGSLLDEALPVISQYSGWATIKGAAHSAKSHALRLERISPYLGQFEQVAELTREPWQEGYAWAQQLRQTLDLDGTPLRSMAQLANAIGESDDELERALRPVNALAANRLIDGVVAWDVDQSPGFGLRKVHASARRFHFCRALAEAVASPWTDSLITRAHSERQQRNRAFAAEFLAPSSGLRQRVTRSVVDSDDIDELATEFGVSSLLVEQQIKNHRIAHVWEPTV